MKLLLKCQMILINVLKVVAKRNAKQEWIADTHVTAIVILIPQAN